MRQNKQGFSILEVLIASIILTISVFWIYKLIWENIKIIERSDKYNQSLFLSENIKQCIDNIWFQSFYSNVSTDYNFNLGVSGSSCSIWLWSTTIDGEVFTFSWKILNKTPTQLEWNISIVSESIGINALPYLHLKK